MMLLKLAIITHIALWFPFCDFPAGSVAKMVRGCVGSRGHTGCITLFLYFMRVKKLRRALHCHVGKTARACSHLDKLLSERFFGTEALSVGVFVSPELYLNTITETEKCCVWGQIRWTWNVSGECCIHKKKKKMIIIISKSINLFKTVFRAVLKTAITMDFPGTKNNSA